MITDEWQGLRVYRSTDLNTWEKQGLLLDKPGKRFQDTPQGAHVDVVVAGIKLIYSISHTQKVNHIPKPEMMNQATYRINTGEVVFK
jgi:hypothetical protein